MKCLLLVLDFVIINFPHKMSNLLTDLTPGELIVWKAQSGWPLLEVQNNMCSSKMTIFKTKKKKKKKSRWKNDTTSNSTSGSQLRSRLFHLYGCGRGAAVACSHFTAPFHFLILRQCPCLIGCGSNYVTMSRLDIRRVWYPVRTSHANARNRVVCT